MYDENRVPTLESLLRDMIANQHSIHDDIQDIQTRLIALERTLEDSSADKPDPADEIDVDDLYKEAKAIVIEANKASTSFLQRQLRIGYSKASMLIDMLEVNEVIGPQDGSSPRNVLKNEEK